MKMSTFGTFAEKHFSATFRKYLLINVQDILDINYVDFSQFQRCFIPQAELEQAFRYITHKPIDFSIDF